MVPEGRRIFPNLDVKENLRTGANTISKRDVAGQLERVYEVFPILESRSGRRAGSLCGGEQQMLAVGRALMFAPAAPAGRRALAGSRPAGRGDPHRSAADAVRRRPRRDRGRRGPRASHHCVGEPATRPGKGPLIFANPAAETETVSDRHLEGGRGNANENSGRRRAGRGAAGFAAGGSGGSRRGRQLLEGRRLGRFRRALRPDPGGTRRRIAGDLGPAGGQASRCSARPTGR